MPHLLAILDEGGRTLLVKAAGDIQAPSFPTLGLLCSIATFASSKGYTVSSFHTTNVQIVYQGFADSSLLLVLATSNLLLSKDRLKQLLRAVYAGLRLTVGKQLLCGSDPHHVDVLKRKLRGVTWLDQLVRHDAVLPCVMLPAPQWLAVAPHEGDSMHAILTNLCAALTASHEPQHHKRQQVLPQPQQQLFAGAALLREGLYVCCSGQWEHMPMSEQLLLQHMAASMSENKAQDTAGSGNMQTSTAMQVYITCTDGQEQQLQFLETQLGVQGAQLLLLCSMNISVDDMGAASRRCLQQLNALLMVPACCAPPMPGVRASLAHGHCTMPDLVVAVATDAAQHAALLGGNSQHSNRQADSPKPGRQRHTHHHHDVRSDQDSQPGTPTRHHQSPSHTPTQPHHNASPPSTPHSKARLSHELSTASHHSHVNTQSIQGSRVSHWQGPPAGSVVLYWCGQRAHAAASPAASSGAGLSSPTSGGVAYFNPLVSPSLLRQLRSPGSSHSLSHRSLSISTIGGEGAAPGPMSDEALSAYFKASCDLVAAFMLEYGSSIQGDQQGDIQAACNDSLPATPKTSRKAKGAALPWQRASQPVISKRDSFTEPALQKHNSTPAGALDSMPGTPVSTPTTAIKRLANRFFGAFTAMGWATPRASRRRAPFHSRHGDTEQLAEDDCVASQEHPLQEVQVLADGKRLVALDAPMHRPGAAAGRLQASVFLLCSGAAADRQVASQTARHLHDTLCGLQPY